MIGGVQQHFAEEGRPGAVSTRAALLSLWVVLLAGACAPAGPNPNHPDRCWRRGRRPRPFLPSKRLGCPDPALGRQARFWLRPGTPSLRAPSRQPGARRKGSSGTTRARPGLERLFRSRPGPSCPWIAPGRPRTQLSASRSSSRPPTRVFPPCASWPRGVIRTQGRRSGQWMPSGVSPPARPIAFWFRPEIFSGR